MIGKMRIIKTPEEKMCIRDRDSVTVKELWEKSAELVCTLDDAHTIVTASGTEYVNGGNGISKAYNDGTLVSVDVYKRQVFI